MFEVAEFSIYSFLTLFFTKQALVAPNSTYIGVIWSNFHADSEFWSPSDKFMVEKSIYIENTDFFKFSIFKNRFLMKNRYPGMEYG